MTTKFLNFFLQNTYFLIDMWWPWVNFFNEVFLLQILLIIIFTYIVVYHNIYYILLYTFMLFFLLGIYLSIIQLDLFTAFLWLIECSVIFVFLLLLFYLNIKGLFTQTNVFVYKYFVVITYIIFFIFILPKSTYNTSNLSLYFLLDNSYECVFNFIQNDLFVFFISYYVLNNMEFIFVGFLLLVGSVVCVNLYSVNKNTRLQNNKPFLNIFNFFIDMCSFVFLRKQNIVKQGNVKPALKVFIKK